MHFKKRFLFPNKTKNTIKNESKNSKLLFVFCIVWYVFIALSFIEDLIKYHIIISNYILMLFCVISVQILQYKKYFFTARILFVFYTTLVIFLFSNFVPIYSGLFIEYFFLFPPSISLIFINNKKINLSVLILCFCLYFIPNFFFKHYAINSFNNLNNVMLFFTMYIITYYFKNLNLKNEKKLEEQKEELKTINDFQSQFFINISHEIRTPLTLIKGGIGELKNYEKKAPQLKEIQKELHNQVNNITAMVDDVLDLAKMETSSFHLTKKEMSCSNLVQKIHTSFEAIFKQKQITFELDIQHNFLIDGDHIQLGRAISNLIVNASKYTDANGKVIVKIYKEANSVVIAVKDNGIGISDTDIKKICNQFYQVKNHINSAGGSGIGLSLTSKIINLHDGELSIESEIGIGSTFKITLPLKETLTLNKLANQKTLKEEEPVEITTSIEEQKKLFLIVDDNLNMLQYITKLLNNYGYKSIHAENGSEALQLMMKNNIDFIITDYMMPKMDGFHFIKNLREQHIHIPILMLTARNDYKSRLDVFRLGIDDYLTKPFENKEFIIRIQNALKNYQQRTKYIDQENISTEEIETSKNWINLVEAYIFESSANREFKQADIAAHFNISTSTLYRKIKLSRGLTTNELVKEVKLQKAYKIINEQDDISLKELALEVGFQHTSYFSKIYKSRFGIKPLTKND